MINPKFVVFLFIIGIMYPSFGFCKTSPYSFTATNQLQYWSQNVKNNMPAALLSKLSPLEKDDNELFTSLASKQPFSANPKFCSLANLACYPEMNNIKSLGNGYGYNNNKASKGHFELNSIKPLGNGYGYNNNKASKGHFELNSVKPLGNGYGYNNNKASKGHFELDSIKPLGNGYGYNNNKASKGHFELDSIKPLGNGYGYNNNKASKGHFELDSIKPLGNGYGYNNNKVSKGHFELDSIKPLGNGYGYNNNKASKGHFELDSIKPLGNGYGYNNNKASKGHFELDSIKPLGNGYGYNNNKASKGHFELDSIKPLGNGYGYNNNKASKGQFELNSVKPLGNGYGYNNNKASVPVEDVNPFSFFRISILKQGNRVHLTDLNNQFPERSFLPAKIASKIPLVESDLQKIFPESFANPIVKGNIETALFHCGTEALKGEIKSCPKSLEEMIEFSKTTLDSKRLVALTSKSTDGSGKELVIGNVKRINVNKIVSCHEIFLHFSAYVCHMLTSTQIYAVDVVEPETKAPVNTFVAICHMDTSAWPSDHAAFKILKLSPGKGEACHWMTRMDLLFVGAEENIV